MTPRYRLEHVVRRYRPIRSEGDVEALRVPSLEVAPGEILAVVGPNGSGKSTLLETMAFLARPDEGRILLDGCDVWEQATTLAARRRCPMLLQRTVLFKTTVLKNVMYGLRTRGMSRAEARRKAEHVLRLVRLEGLTRRMHRELSGGERRRVALARLLALEPEILLLDEPTAHVDYSNARLIDEIIRQLHATTGMTVIVASHDLGQAQSLADRVVTLVDGRLFSGTLDGPDRLEIVPAGAANDCPLGGRIEAVHQHQGLCRVIVRLATGQRVCASLAQADYTRLGLNLGHDVGLRLADEALRTLTRDADLPV